MTTNTVKTDYAYLMLKMEQHQKAMHNSCLKKNWQEAREHAKEIDRHCDALMLWLSNQSEGQDAKFEEVQLS